MVDNKSKKQIWSPQCTVPLFYTDRPLLAQLKKFVPLQNHKPNGHWKRNAVFPEGWNSNCDILLDDLKNRVGLTGLHYIWMANTQPKPVVAARSKAWVYGRSLAGIAGSSSPEGMDVCFLWMLCIVHVHRRVRLADHSSGGVISYICHWVWSAATVTFSTYDEEAQEAGLKKKGIIYNCCLDQLLTKNDSLADSIL
jgi:hypothetical protein